MKIQKNKKIITIVFSLILITIAIGLIMSFYSQINNKKDLNENKSKITIFGITEEQLAEERKNGIYRVIREPEKELSEEEKKEKIKQSVERLNARLEEERRKIKIEKENANKKNIPPVEIDEFLISVNENDFEYEDYEKKSVKIFEEIRESEVGWDIQTIDDVKFYNEPITSYYPIRFDFKKNYSGVANGFVKNIIMRGANNEYVEFENCKIMEKNIYCRILQGGGSLYIDINGGGYDYYGNENHIIIKNGKGYIYDLNNILKNHIIIE